MRNWKTADLPSVLSVWAWGAAVFRMVLGDRSILSVQRNTAQLVSEQLGICLDKRVSRREDRDWLLSGIQHDFLLSWSFWRSCQKRASGGGTNLCRYW